MSKQLRAVDEHLEIGLYRLAYYMLQTMPPPDTIADDDEREKAVQMRGALIAFIVALERRYNLPRTRGSRDERLKERNRY